MKKQLLFYLFLLLGGTFVSTTSYSQGWLPLGSGATFGNTVSDGVRDILEVGGNTYAVGSFHSGDGVSTHDFAAIWNGTSWSQMGTGFAYNANDGVYSLVEFGGAIFIGGLFTYDDGTNPAFSNLAKWDDVNNHWVSAGTSADGIINELIVYNSNLYAGGDFSSIGGITTNNIAKYNGATWSALGAGGTSADEPGGGVEPDQVTAMVEYNSQLIVGGFFGSVDGSGIVAKNVAGFNGTSWARLGGPSDIDGGGTGGDGLATGRVPVMAMEVFNSELYVGGTFSKCYNGIASPTTVNRLTVWDGSSWSAPSKAISSINKINALTVFDGYMYAGNDVETNIHSWNGSAIWNWTSESSSLPINTLSNNGSTLYYGAYSGGVYYKADPLPSFSASSTAVCAGQEVTFTDNSTSTNTISVRSWTFEGGTPSTTTDQNPVVTFAAGGPYDVTLAVTSSDGTNSITKTDYITIEDAVSVSGDPSPSTICSSENATFSVSGASGTGGVTYQWQINDGTGYVNIVDASGEISGATFSTLTLVTPLVSLDGANVQCVVTNGCGSTATSAEALLTITAAPEITENPVHQAVCEDGGDVSFTIVSTGTTTYQWQYYNASNAYVDLSDAGAYLGTATATLSITGADNTTILNELRDTDFSDGKTQAYYRCVLTANGCITNSGLHYLTIYASPTITTQPIDVTNCNIGSGATATFSIVAEVASTVSTTSISGINYQWQVDDGTGYVDVVDDAIYSGATSINLSLTGATYALSGNVYKCIIGNCTSPVESNTATLTIDDKPVLVSSPVSTKICNGDDATFTAEATGNNLIYQWQVAPSSSSSYVDIVNDATYSAIAGTLDITGATTNLNNLRYRCVISSGVCDVANNKALNTSTGVLTVYSDVTLTPSSTSSWLTVCDGGSTTLRVTRGGGYNSTFHQLQWQEDVAGTGLFTDITDGTTYSGATTYLLTILSADLTMDGKNYRCVVTNCTGTIASTPETLTVNQLPLVTTSPQSQTVCLYEQVVFTAEATGTGVSYLWEYSSDGTNWSNASFANGYTTASMTINSATTNYNGYQFKCVASSASPCATTAESNPATLTVNEITIITQPTTATICNGENFTFYTGAVGDGLSYQWQENGVDLVDGGIYSGATTAELTITGVTTDLHGARYNCIVSGNCADVTSWDGYLTVNGTEKPVITASFTDATQPYLYVSNVGGDAYEWFLNGNSYSSGAADLYVSEEGSYTVIVYYLGCPSEESDAQVIIVTELPSELMNSIQAYPNPVVNELIIRLDRLSENTQINVMSLDGKMKITQQATTIENSIDMSSLAKGTYLVQVTNAEKTLTYKVIKQ